MRERGREPRNTRTDERRHRLSVRSSGASRFMYRRVAEPDAEQHNVLRIKPRLLRLQQQPSRICIIGAGRLVMKHTGLIHGDIPQVCRSLTR